MSDQGPQSSGSAAEQGAAFTLVHHFLIAMPGMADPSFTGAVVYLCEHTAQGALGLVINRPIDLTLQNLFERVDLKLDIEDLAHRPVLFGGPVQTDRGFVLHDDLVGQYESTLLVRDGLALTMSKDVLKAVADGEGPKHILVTRGYAGWGEGQLEQELSANAWLTVEADAAVLFDVPPEARFEAAMQLLGIDPAMLSDQPARMTARTVLAFDLGEVRVGVAVGNTLLRQATPLAIVPALPREVLFEEIGELLRAWQPELLVVGLPRSADGEASAMTARCERFANQLNGRFHLPVVRVDERYSSLDAEALQREARQEGRARARKALDDVAAAVILKRYFDEVDANA